MVEEWKMLVWVEFWFVKFVLGCVVMDEENEEGLLGLLLGICFGVLIVMVLVLRFDVVKFWESLFDGLWGWLMILCEVIWELEVCFVGFLGVDDVLVGCGSEGVVFFMVVFFLEFCLVGVVECWNRVLRLKMFCFLDEGFMIVSCLCGWCWVFWV